MYTLCYVLDCCNSLYVNDCHILLQLYRWTLLVLLVIIIIITINIIINIVNIIV